MFDVKISGATIIDGTSAEGYRGEVLVAGGVITEIHRTPSGESASESIDGDGLVVCPGFIDLHSHSDFTLFSHPGAESKIHQGITTELVGNCGMAPYPLSDEFRDELLKYVGGRSGDIPWSWKDLNGYLDTLGSAGTAVNVGALAAHGSLRLAAMGFSDDEPTPRCLSRMKELLANDLRAGAFGLSTGLIYAPGTYARTDEIVELAGVLGDYGGFYATHLRGESDVLLDAVDEALEIGRKARVPVHIAHLKAAGRSVWGAAEEVIGRMEDAREEGLDVTGDVYPYLAGATGLAALLPPWILRDGVHGLISVLKSEPKRQRIAHEIEHGIEGWWNPIKAAGGWQAVMITGLSRPENARYSGMRVTEIAEIRETTPLDAACDLLVEEEGSVGMIIFMMQEDDVRTFLGADGVSVGTDGSAMSPGKSLTHPRAYGTFPRVLARYVREEGLLSLPEAIHKMTALPAQRLGITDRGSLGPGARADLVMFSPDDIADTATYSNPHAYPEGIEYVFVNGQKVVDLGSHTGNLAGKILRKEQ